MIVTCIHNSILTVFYQTPPRIVVLVLLVSPNINISLMICARCMQKDPNQVASLPAGNGAGMFNSESLRLVFSVPVQCDGEFSGSRSASAPNVRC
jgi:hypothetical protein